jgi:tetratricopeptide (TPR) repeat protein
VDRPQYRAFLSYSHRDAKWGTWLHRALESYRPPKQLVGVVTERGPVPKRLSPVFRDREELASATDLGAVISEALANSACQIVICSPRSAKSKWVNEEILAFKRLGREDRILCLIVDGEPNASDNPAQADQECFPPALRYRLGADGQLSDIRTEPIAADARPGKDGKTNAKLKLIAGVLAVGFDALKRREQQRRNRKLFFIASGAVAGMVLTTSLAVMALIARATAERQTVRAEAEAETARQTTKFLVELFRISDPSEARGKSVTAKEMLEKGTTRIESELKGQPAIQATLLDTVGTVYMGIGLYDQANQLLTSAVEKRRRLADGEPAVLSDSLNHLGDVLSLQAQYDAAEKAYLEARTLQGSQPSNPQTQAVLARSLFGLGIVLSGQGRYPEAERSLREALEMQQRLFGRVNGDVASTLQNLAHVLGRAGDLNAAIAMMQDTVAMQRELRGTQPHPALAEALNDLAILQQEKGQYEESEKLLLEAISIKRRLYGHNHVEIASGLNNLAFVLQDKGDLARAEASYLEALHIQRALLPAVHPEIANTLNNLAFVEDDKGDLEGALLAEGEALDIYKKLFPGDHPEVARIMNRIGYWLTRAGRYKEAEVELQDALAMRRRLVGDSHPDVASSLTHLAILQVATRRYREALLAAREAVQISTKALSETHWKTAVAQSVEGAALTGLGDYSDAEGLLRRSYLTLVEDAGALPTYRSLARAYVDKLYRSWGRPWRPQPYGTAKAK